LRGEQSDFNKYSEVDAMMYTIDRGIMVIMFTLLEGQCYVVNGSDPSHLP